VRKYVVNVRDERSSLPEPRERSPVREVIEEVDVE
jgi:hypothetical protein